MKILLLAITGLGLLGGCSWFANDENNQGQEETTTNFDKESPEESDTAQEQEDDKDEEEEESKEDSEPTEENSENPENSENSEEENEPGASETPSTNAVNESESGPSADQAEESSTFDDQSKAEVVPSQDGQEGGEESSQGHSPSTDQPQAPQADQAQNTPSQGQETQQGGAEMTTTSNVEDYAGYWMNFDNLASDYGSTGLYIDSSNLISFIVDGEVDRTTIHDAQPNASGVTFTVSSPESGQIQVSYSVSQSSQGRDQLTTQYGHTFYRISPEEYQSLNINL